jgi:hypothetical protein
MICNLKVIKKKASGGDANINVIKTYDTFQAVLFEEISGPTKSVGTLKLRGAVVRPEMQSVKMKPIFTTLFIAVANFIQDNCRTVMDKILPKG